MNSCKYSSLSLKCCGVSEISPCARITPNSKGMPFYLSSRIHPWYSSDGGLYSANDLACTLHPRTHSSGDCVTTAIIVTSGLPSLLEWFCFSKEKPFNLGKFQLERGDLKKRKPYQGRLLICHISMYTQSLFLNRGICSDLQFERVTGKPPCKPLEVLFFPCLKSRSG